MDKNLSIPKTHETYLKMDLKSFEYGDEDNKWNFAPIEESFHHLILCWEYLRDQIILLSGQNCNQRDKNRFTKLADTLFSEMIYVSNILTNDKLQRNHQISSEIWLIKGICQKENKPELNDVKNRISATEIPAFYLLRIIY